MSLLNAVRTPRLAGFLLRHSMSVVLLMLIVLATIVSRGIFIQPGNLITVLFQSAVVGILAVGQALVIISGGIDLSVAAVTILVAVLMGGLSSSEQTVMPNLGLPFAIAVGMGVSLLVGLINGLLVARTRIPPFVVTLAMLLAVTSLSFLITQGYPVYYPDPFFESVGQMKAVSVPLPVFVWFGVAALAALILSRTRLGIQIYAVGTNERAARLSGIPVGRTRLLVYTISGLLAGIGGLMFLARTGYAIPSGGENFLLQVIAGAAVGGISLSGGQGSIKDALVGVLVLAVLGNLMTILLVSPYIQSAIEGMIMLGAVALNYRVSTFR